MDKLIIVGAGGHGRCCLDIAREKYDEIVFLDDGLVGQIVNDCKVIGKIEEMKALFPQCNNVFIAVGNNAFRKQLYLQAKKIGYNIITLISNEAIVSKYASIKEGSVIFPHAVIEPNTSIGYNCIICANATINHDAIIHDHCLIYSNTVIRPNVVINELTRIGSNCTITFGKEIEEGSDIKDGEVVI
ncbi:PglD-related sugar-binding protein [Faecalibacillus intestinalis]|uniref:PglD-related sugar-binding protein n=1 Tax=Faecalibacillus intestinalis TaxID=1982626 RepID=UPI003520C6E0